MPDFHVVKVLPRGRVIVDASQLRRVVIRGTNEVLSELMPQKHAEIYAQTFNDCGGDAIVVPYLTPKREREAKPSRRRAVR